MAAITKKIPQMFFSLYLLFAAGLLYWVVIMSGSSDGDTLEHVHSSWLVWSGKIPYKDFFQHHNPLLWYVGAPLVGAYQYSLRAVDAVNLLTVTATIITAYYIYRINKDFLNTNLGGLIAAAFFIFPHESLYVKDFKPDNYMTVSLIIGLYYFLAYIKKKGLFNLVISYLFFFAAFMFTQKALPILLCIGLYILYLIYTKKMTWTDNLLSALMPILIYIGFLTFLYNKDILTFYFKANFELNSHIPEVFHTRRFIYPSAEMSVPILLALYAILTCLYKGSIYLKTIGIVFISEFIIRMYYFTPFVYYFAFLHAVSSVLAGFAIIEIAQKRKYIMYMCMTYFFVLGSIYAYIYSKRITVGDSYKYGASGFVLSLTNPCDYVLNGYRIGYNLFNKDIDFVWNLKGQIDVIASTIGLLPLSDLESLVRKYRPKIIYGGNYYDTYREYRGNIGVYPIHWISKQLLEDMYTPLNRDDLYILKPEYQSYDCHYNRRTKTYEYRDKH